jgi:AMP deaminase
MVRNIFEPMFEATLNPADHPRLDAFLSQIGGVDCVDDEGVFDLPLLAPSVTVKAREGQKERQRTLYPVEFTGKGLAGGGTEGGKAINPPYSYYLYYIYANLKVLNSLRRAKGMNTFAFKPHCGECGEAHHLSTAFLLADSVNHGIRLEIESCKTHTLQYLYYLAQVGLAMCPLSNDSLFTPLHLSPVGLLFKRGLRVALGTDDPLQFHATPAPLIEEYTIAKRIFGLSTIDQCEIARSSCLISTFSDDVKRGWHGPGCLHSFSGGETLPHLPFTFGKYFPENNPQLTNVPAIRASFRRANLMRELAYISKVSMEYKPSGATPSSTSRHLPGKQPKPSQSTIPKQAPDQMLQPLPLVKNTQKEYDRKPHPSSSPRFAGDISDPGFAVGFVAGVCTVAAVVLAVARGASAAARN